MTGIRPVLFRYNSGLVYHQDGYQGEWRETIFLFAGCIDLMTLSMNLAPNNTGTASFSKLPNVTQERDSPFQRWRVMVPDTDSFVLKAPWTSGISRWRTPSSTMRSNTLARTRFGPVPVPKIQAMVRISENFSLVETDTL